MEAVDEKITLSSSSGWECPRVGASKSKWWTILAFEGPFFRNLCVIPNSRGGECYSIIIHECWRGRWFFFSNVAFIFDSFCRKESFTVAGRDIYTSFNTMDLLTPSFIFDRFNACNLCICNSFSRLDFNNLSGALFSISFVFLYYK